MKKIIAVTGATGSVGKETVSALMSLPREFCLRLLVSKNVRAAEKYKKRYGDRIDYYVGDVRNREDCEKLVKRTSYLLHMGALVPPTAEYKPQATMQVNATGTDNLVKAVKAEENKTGVSLPFLYVSSVAVYGHRSFRQRWGRVGDPLIPSAFDVYGSSKLSAERSILDAGLKDFMIFRLSAVLYDELLKKNMGDGLIFQTWWDCPIEWVTAKETGELFRAVIEGYENGNKSDFSNRVYNVGGGENSRQTGYETFNDTFSLIGGTPKKVFKPNQSLTRNFHCFWFSDGNGLQELFSFRSQPVAEFWHGFMKRHKLYNLARIVPASLIRALFIKPLLKNPNAPIFWVNNGDVPRIQAFFGGMENYKKIPDLWDGFTPACEKQGYAELKKDDKAEFLDHGYNENKPDCELDIEDMRSAAEFRGGKCLSESMKKGDLYTPLKWECHQGHIFTATPYAVLKAGHWCKECCYPNLKWNFDELSRHIPFFAQVWRDTHAESENYVYGIKDGKSYMIPENYRTDA